MDYACICTALRSYAASVAEPLAEALDKMIENMIAYDLGPGVWTLVKPTWEAARATLNTYHEATKEGAMSKRVRITLELSESFIRLLHGHVGLTGGLALERRESDVAGVLARVVLAEASGAFPEQVCIPPPWRPDIEAVHDERRWREEKSPVWMGTR